MATEIQNPIQDWLTKPAPAAVWHYTSLGGLLGIVERKQIYATDIRYLNDREEFVHAQAFVDQVVGELDEVDENRWHARQAAKGFTEGLYSRGVLSPTYLQIFVASFSTAEDQLSQWRAYSRGSTGVSLGFDLRNLLLDIPTSTLSVFAQCIYDDHKKRELIAHSIKKFAKDTSDIWKQIGDQNLQSQLLQKLKLANPNWSETRAIEELRTSQKEWIDTEIEKIGALLAVDLLTLGGLLKHSSFKEEQEWRLVLPMKVDSAPKVHSRCFRTNATTLIPYVEFDLAKAGDPLPLTSLILGPGSEPEISIEAARSFLAAKNLKIIPRTSKTPFRPW
jgi:hypothetical protein